MGIYAANGTTNVTVINSTGPLRGIYALDGSLNCTVSPGDRMVGHYAPNGAMWVTKSPGSLFTGSYAPDGSRYVTDDPNEYSGALRVTVLSGDLLGKVYSADFTAGVPSTMTYTRGSLATMFDSTGKLTFCPNNLFLNSATLSTQSVTLEAGNYLLSFTGTGSVSISGGFVGSQAGSGVSTRVTLAFTATAGSSTFTVTGSVTNARLSRVTYETSFRSVDDINTTDSAYHGARLNYGLNSTTLRGLLIEPLRTNRALWSRDLTNAVWVKSSTTALKDQTGIDGVANSASSLTATAINGTCLQTITAASAVSIMSCAIKRLVGTGTVEMTTDNGTTWTPVTVTAAWTFVEIPAQTLANPVCGFRLATSGDSIAIDCINNETGTSTPVTASRSTPIITTTAIVTRNADDLRLLGLNFLSVYCQTEGTMVFSFSTDNLASDSTILCIDDTTTGQNNQVDIRSILSTSVRARVRSAGGSSADVNPGPFSVGANIKVSFGYKKDNFNSSLNGSVTAPDTLGEMPATTMTQLEFGQRGSTGVQAIAHLRSLDLYSVRLSDATLQTLSV